MADDSLYEVCPICHDQPARVSCPCCRGVRFVPVGTTTGQLEAFVERERALRGDPGVPAFRRRKVLFELWERVRAALGVKE